MEIFHRKANVDDISSLIELRINFLKEVEITESSLNFTELKVNLSDYFTKNIKNSSFISWLAHSKDNLIISTSGLCFYNVPPTLKNPLGKV